MTLQRRGRHSFGQPTRAYQASNAIILAGSLHPWSCLTFSRRTTRRTATIQCSTDSHSLCAERNPSSHFSPNKQNLPFETSELLDVIFCCPNLKFHELVQRSSPFVWNIAFTYFHTFPLDKNKFSIIYRYWNWGSPPTFLLKNLKAICSCCNIRCEPLFDKITSTRSLLNAANVVYEKSPHTFIMKAIQIHSLFMLAAVVVHCSFVVPVKAGPNGTPKVGGVASDIGASNLLPFCAFVFICVVGVQIVSPPLPSHLLQTRLPRP